MLVPIYTTENCRAAYQLNWSLSVFWSTPGPTADQWLDPLRSSTERDGVRVLEHRFKSPDISQFLLSTRPEIVPTEVIRSVKGRLQHLIRDRVPKAFRRNYSIHSIGTASLATVADYVGSQLEHHTTSDVRAQSMLETFQIQNLDVDLSRPQRSSHGEFRYNLHLVLVHDGRWNEVRETAIAAVREMIVNAARAKGHRLARAGILADHVHLLVGCDLSEPPQDVALAYLNNLAFAQGMRRVYQFGYFVGTVGEYDLGAVRGHLA